MNPYAPNYLSLPYSNTQRYSPKPLNSNYYSNYPSELSNNFYQNNSIANSLINNRISRLNYEKEIIQGVRNPYYPPTPYTYHSSSNYSSLANFGQNIISPSNYIVDFTIPIPHPLEIPKMCSPVSPPRYDTGGPLQGKHCCHKNNAMDILLLLTQIGQIPPKPKTPKEKQNTRNKKGRKT